MPSTGTPSSNTTWGARSVLSSVAEAWLPERITPRGLKARTNGGSTSQGCSSQDPPVSRTRRAMSCVTWEPKSRMRILSVDVVIRRFLRDLHVVDVGFAHARGGDLDEIGLGAHLVDGAAAGVAHARAEPSHELQDDGGDRALVRDAALDAFGHQLVGVHLRILEIAVARSLLHGAQRAHAAIRLVRAPLEELDLAGGFLAAGEEAPQHHAGSTRRDGLRDV